MERNQIGFHTESLHCHIINKSWLANLIMNEEKGFKRSRITASLPLKWGKSFQTSFELVTLDVWRADNEIQFVVYLKISQGVCSFNEYVLNKVEFIWYTYF